MRHAQDESFGLLFLPVRLSVFIAQIFYAFDFMLILLLSRLLPPGQKGKKLQQCTDRGANPQRKGLCLTQNLLSCPLLRENGQLLTRTFKSAKNMYKKCF